MLRESAQRELGEESGRAGLGVGIGAAARGPRLSKADGAGGLGLSVWG